jgi:hypothetical protein
MPVKKIVGRALDTPLDLGGKTVTGNVTFGNIFASSIFVNNVSGVTTQTLTTANVVELTNLYYTNARARTALSVTGSGSYDNSTGIITITGGVSSVNGQVGAVSLTTANIAEQSNLYYTNARARTAISVTGSGSYDNSTGIITITGGVSSVAGATGAVSNAQLAAGIANTTISNITVVGAVDANYFSEKVTNVTASTANTTIDWSLGGIFDMNLATSTTVTFTNPPPSLRARTISIIVRPTGSGTKTLTVQRAKYTDGVAPVLSGPGNIDMLSFMTVDGGNSYFGSYVLAALA